MSTTVRKESVENRVFIGRHVDEMGIQGDRYIEKVKGRVKFADTHNGVVIKQELTHPFLAFITHPIATTRLFLHR